MVVLFGSRVKGGLPPGPDSDVDVAVLGCPRGRFWECWSALEETLESLTGDVVNNPLTPTPRRIRLAFRSFLERRARTTIPGEVAAACK
jgi:predicted nucleotidyltransferase